MSDKLRSYEPILMTLLRLGDAALGAGLFVGLSFLINSFNEEYMILTVLIFFMTLACFHWAGLYVSWRVTPLLAEINHVLFGCIFIYVLLATMGYFIAASYNYSKTVVLSWMIIWPICLGFERYALRLVLRHYRRSGRNLRRAVIAGAGDIGYQLAHWLKVNVWSGTDVVGFFDDNVPGDVNGWPLLGKLDSLPKFCKENKIDVIYVTLPWGAESKTQWLIRELADSTSSIYIVPDIFFFDLILQSRIMHLGDLPAIALRDTPMRGMSYLLKRVEDILLASTVLIFASPVMLLIAAAVKLTSSGPVVFKQWRYGLNGESFIIYKFRTMTVCEDGYTFKQAKRGDSRLTKVGGFLRQTSLDELPQFINVLQGRMSIVGPRPHPVAMNEQFRKLVPGYMLRHKVKPGITGLAQVKGYRGETETLEKMEMRFKYDLEYLRHWSLMLDLKIIALTVFNNAWKTNAY